MQLPRGSGLEFLDKIVRRSLNYYSNALKLDSFKLPDLFYHEKGPVKRQPVFELPTLDSLRKPVESLIRGLNSAVAQFTEKPEKVDYNVVVNTFLPPGAKLLKPEYPDNSNEIQFEDLDGDGRNELVASYRTYEGIKTLILKKDEVQWYRMAEFSIPDFEEIHYRNSADVAGDGKKYMLLGLSSKSRYRTLFAYSFDDGNARKIFSKNYNKLELQKSHSRSGGPVKTAFALWNEVAPDIYDIELVEWNGLELEKLDNTRYLSGKVIPYYVRKLRQNPDDAAGWYNLANVMSKSGNKSDAEVAVRIGLGHTADGQLKEKFNVLKSRL